MITASFTLLPALFIALSFSLLLIVKRPIHTQFILCIIWLPSVLVLFAGIPFLSYKQEIKSEQRQKEWDKQSQSNAPGERIFIDLTDRTSLPEEAQGQFSAELLPIQLSKEKDSASGSEPQKSDPYFWGYQLIEGNHVQVKRTFSKPEITKISDYKLVVPDYKLFDPIVRTGSKAPARAWLWPKQVKTHFYVYKDRVEAALSVDQLNDEQYRYATQIEFENYTGKNIARLKINGWDLGENLIDAKHCRNHNAAQGLIPALIASSLLIEWQVLGEDTWHSVLTENAPADPVLSPDQLQFGQGLHILLGHDGQLALKRQLTVKLTRVGSTKNIFSQEMPDFKDFESKHAKCMPLSLKWPGDVFFYNMTKSDLTDTEGWFSGISTFQRGSIRNHVFPVVFEKIFDQFYLKKNIKLGLKSKDSIGLIRKIVLPRPDYSKMESLLALHKNELSPADFGLAFFINENSIESAVVFNKSDSHSKRNYSIGINNYTGREIGRVQVNGLDVVDRSLGEYFGVFCGQSLRTRTLPLSNPTVVRWQWMGDKNWQSVTVDPGAINTSAENSEGRFEIVNDIYLGNAGQKLLVSTLYPLEKDVSCLNHCVDSSKADVDAFLLRANACPKN
ncbi:MAG: hypothetical protein NT086_12885 [Proteobacteria bacterium]|nr:hypothetical protein [Pseudomonadota bacterium]